jgi:hypothetical protein
MPRAVGRKDIRNSRSPRRLFHKPSAPPAERSLGPLRGRRRRRTPGRKKGPGSPDSRDGRGSRDGAPLHDIGKAERVRSYLVQHSGQNYGHGVLKLFLNKIV